MVQQNRYLEKVAAVNGLSQEVRHVCCLCAPLCVCVLSVCVGVCLCVHFRTASF